MAVWDTGSSALPLGPKQHVLACPSSGPGPLPQGSMPSVSHTPGPCVLTQMLPILQMAPSEGTVTQIGLLSQDIHRLTVGF